MQDAFFQRIARVRYLETAHSHDGVLLLVEVVHDLHVQRPIGRHAYVAASILHVLHERICVHTIANKKANVKVLLGILATTTMIMLVMLLVVFGK